MIKLKSSRKAYNSLGLKDQHVLRDCYLLPFQGSQIKEGWIQILTDGMHNVLTEGGTAHRGERDLEGCGLPGTGDQHQQEDGSPPGLKGLQRGCVPGAGPELLWKTPAPP